MLIILCIGLSPIGAKSITVDNDFIDWFDSKYAKERKRRKLIIFESLIRFILIETVSVG